MVYSVLQFVVIAAALVFSTQHMARKLMPRTVKRLTQAILPHSLAARVQPTTTDGGCGDSGTCGTCKTCGNIASMLRDLPPANR